LKKCGIIGGVGPGATIDLFRLIVKHTPAVKDQEHLRVFIDNHPQIPDRTEALLEGGELPDKYFVESINILKNAGADFIVCPCNTAHIFLRKLREPLDFNLIDMIEETVRYLRDNHIMKAGLLSTSGTAKTGIYQETAGNHGIEILIPDEDGIRNEMEAIYGKEGIKAGARFEKSNKNKSIFRDIIQDFRRKGAMAAIMGCTEIPLCLDHHDSGIRLINPTEILALAVVRYAMAEPEGSQAR
jgi:aspartate racemase